MATTLNLGVCRAVSGWRSMAALAVAMAVTMVGVLAGCTATPQPPSASAWDLALMRSAVADQNIVAPPLTPILGDRARLVTWKMAGQDLPESGPYQFKRPVWTTVDGELRAFCERFTARYHPDQARLQARLEQVLGLRQGDGSGRVLVTFDSLASDVFRPCPDPDIRTTQCPIVFNNQTLKEALDKDPEASSFLLQHMLMSYVWPTGYPFTRRGFTLDWAPPVEDSPRFGLSEYVTRPDTMVQIISVTASLTEYCRPDQVADGP